MPQHPEQSQQPQRGRTGRAQPTSRLIGGVALTASLALLPLATACSGSGEDDAKASSKPTKISASPAAELVAPAKVEVIANLTGCKPKIRIDADELRQGLCHTPKVDYLITTFPEEKYKQTWLDSAAIYGGKYLVGTRWVVSAKEPEMLDEFRAKIGGKIQQLRGIGPTPGPS
ncbi:hypothetical protein ACFZBP_36800 [Streptomyces sp. NPDC008086]|uniref:hypothetical protein n=1 Tax=Streptomyces sp. NPDC008086 TaxID=3364807 RepID=UPI0036E210B9